jgi:DNA-binding NtrC family response regulator
MKIQKLLIVEDDAGAAFGYERYLAKNGYSAVNASTLKDAKTIAQSDRFDAILLDLQLPDGNSIEWIPEVKELQPMVPVIVITGSGDIPTVVRAIKNGADNFLAKPVEMSDLKAALAKCIEIGDLRRRNAIQQRLSKNETPFIGSSKAISECLEYARVAAANDTVIVLFGETGTGKGVLARWIHNQSDRGGEPFVELNCSSLKGELLRSELFGHARGSFTSAIKDKEGLIEVADGGTLFLDEIGDMDIDVQAQLLKTIEEKSFRRVGDNQLRKSNFRLMCATNRDLLKETETGRFRKDLYYRICVFPITLPPLRERADDIAGFTDYLLAGFGYAHFPLSSGILHLLMKYAWPGNLRELKNMLERAVILAQGKPLAPQHFPGLNNTDIHFSQPAALRNLDDIENAHVLMTVQECGGDKYKASEALGISLSTLYRKLNNAKKTPEGSFSG